MIAYLEGEILQQNDQQVVVFTTSGVGYQTYLAQKVEIGQRVKLFTCQIFRENAQEMFGFLTMSEKLLFEKLINVKGVGPKSSFSLVTSIGVEQIIFAIQAEDKKILSKAPGIGPKAAAQIILDLSSKILDISSNVHSCNKGKDSHSATTTTVGKTGLVHEAIMACRELGFEEKKTLNIAQSILAQKQVNSSEELVQLVLKEI